MQTFSLKKSQLEKQWYIINAQGLVLGRMAVEIAKILKGKHKPTFTPNMDCGDYIIVTNANKIHLTGRNKLSKKYITDTQDIPVELKV